MRKRVCSFALVGLLLLGLCACNLFSDDVSRETIFSYVKENQALLEECILQDAPRNNLGKPVYDTEMLGRRTIVKSMYAYTDSVIQFYCGGTGLSTNSTYSGFYYSADDTPYAMEFPTDELEETSPGVFEWRSNTGEEIITERILPCWFYYHMIWY